MKIGFCTGNIYSIIISFILAKTRYINNYKILYISSNLTNGKFIFKRIKKLNIYDEIYYMDEKDTSIEHIKSVEYIDTLHVFSYYNIYVKKLLNNFIGEIILTEEGIGTYTLELGVDARNLDEIKEIWISDKELFDVVNLQNKVVEVKFFEEFFELGDLQQVIFKELNFIFDYTHVGNYNRIYFDQYFTMNSFLEELIFIKELEPILNHYKIKVKKHPLNPNREKFTFLNIETIDIPYYIPWEVILINDIVMNYEKKEYLLISISSSTMYNSIISFSNRINFSIISLNSLFPNNNMSNLEYKIISNKRKQIIQVFDLENFSEILYQLTNYDSRYICNRSCEVFELRNIKNIISIYQDTLKNRLTQGQCKSLSIKYSYIRKVSEKKDIYIWGLGAGGKLIYNILKDIIMINNIGFIDSFKSGSYDEIKIISKDDVECKKEEIFIIIATTEGIADIEKFLKSIKFNRLNYTTIL